ncbi:peptide ABC transporter substrate-binding protein [Candidatus Cryosericum odellii]|jgi:oligopeptide transport system substrate-binding protein|nr:peptide ABC transporter substrate-binding protein [Candidatus Cryosericum odellii]
MTRKIVVFLVLCMLAATFAGCGTKSTGGVATSDMAADQTVRYNLGVEPASLDPALAVGNPELGTLIQLFDGLTRNDKNNVPQPAIATSWDVSTDKLTYTFHLRDAKWSNGDPVTAPDFEYAWKRALAPETAGDFAYQLYYVKNGEAFNKCLVQDGKYYAAKVDANGNPVTTTVNGTAVPVADTTKPFDVSSVGVKALDDKTLEVNLEGPTPYFIDLTTYPTLFPVDKKVVETNPKWAAAPSTFVCDGPFKPTEWAHNDHLTMVKNDTYWDAATVRLTTVIYDMVEDESTALSMYQSGQLDAAANVPSSELKSLVASGDAQILPYLGTYYLNFNNSKKPFNDPRVRQALTLAINRQQIVDNVTKGGELPAMAFIPYGFPDATPNSDFRKVGGETYFKDNDIATAQKLLADAGYPGGKGFPAFTYLMNTSSLHKAIAEAIQQMWKKNLGITCTLKNEEWGVFLQDRDNLNYDVARAGWTADYMDPNTFLDLYITGGGNNDLGWTSKVYDQAIATEKATADQTARLKAMHLAEDTLMKDFAISPIYFYTNPVLLSKRVKDFYQGSIGFVDWKYAYMAPAGK